MASKYCLLFKTAQSEFRAWNTLYSNAEDDVAKESILPIVEITRGRKKPGTGKDVDEDKWPVTEGIFAFQSNVSKVVEAFKDCNEVIIDITREDQLSCYELNEKSQSQNGYEAWTNFVNELCNDIPNLIPTLIINPSEAETEQKYKDNINTQFDVLSDTYQAIAYRAAVLVDPDFMYDLILLKDKINAYIEDKNRFIIELDHEYIRSGMGILHAVRTQKIIEEIHKHFPKAEIIILATSFPSTVDTDHHDSFPLEEVYLFEELKRVSAKDVNLIYGDYGSINPERNDIKGARGWVPRIDYPTDDKRTFYYREKRNKIGEKLNAKGKMAPIYDEYGQHYVNIAKLVLADNFQDIPNSWGINKIKSTALGIPAGKAPSFWISVRMEIHILQQLKRLKLIK